MAIVAFIPDPPASATPPAVASGPRGPAWTQEQIDELTESVDTARTLTDGLQEAFDLVAPTYPTMAAGLEGTSSGEEFEVLSSGNVYKISYRNEGGSAVEISRSPSTAATDALPTSAAFENIQTSVDALTSDPAHAATLVPIAVKLAEAVTSSAATWVSGSGSTRLAHWSFLNGAVNNIAFVLEVPSHWSTMFLDLWFINKSAASGNASLAASILNFGDGESIDSGGASAGLFFAAPVTLLTAKKGRIGPLTVTPGKLSKVLISRTGTSGSDTLASALGLIHIQAVKAS